MNQAKAMPSGAKDSVKRVALLSCGWPRSDPQHYQGPSSPPAAILSTELQISLMSTTRHTLSSKLLNVGELGGLVRSGVQMAGTQAQLPGGVATAQPSQVRGGRNPGLTGRQGSPWSPLHQPGRQGEGLSDNTANRDLAL